jgi:hypothetical protein
MSNCIAKNDGTNLLSKKSPKNTNRVRKMYRLVQIYLGAIIIRAINDNLCVANQIRGSAQVNGNVIHTNTVPIFLA